MSKQTSRRQHATAGDRKNKSWVRASDLAAWAYCRRAWWLARVQGVEPDNRVPLEAGNALHRAHGRALARARVLRASGAVLLILAFLAGLASALLSLAR